MSCPHREPIGKGYCPDCETFTVRTPMSSPHEELVAVLRKSRISLVVGDPFVPDFIRAIVEAAAKVAGLQAPSTMAEKAILAALREAEKP